MKKLISAILCVALTLSLVSVTFSVNAEEPTSGQCGPNVFWEIKNKVLYVNGKGNMYDYMGFEDRPYYVGYGYVNKIVVGNGVTTVGNNAFIHFNAVKEIVLGNTVESIGDYAFAGCASYTSITIPKSVYSINRRAFYSCLALKNIYFESGSVLNYIGNFAFNHCQALTSVSLPSSLRTIGIYAFQDCTALSYVNIPNGVMQIDVGAFYNCSSLKSVSIPGTVKIISNYAFSQCFEMTSLSLGYGVNTLLDGAFCQCRNLNSVSFSDTVVYIGSCAFDDCKSLKTVTLPKYIGNISRNAFGKYTNSSYDTLKVSGFTIRGYKNTAAQTYASDNGFSFVSLGTGYKNPTGVQLSSVMKSKFPNSIETQKLFCTSAAAANKYYTTNDLINAMSKCDYNFPTVSGDFNGDGLDDVAQFYDLQPREVALDVNFADGKEDDTYSTRSMVWTSGTGWSVSNFTGRFASGDFNGDGRDDIAAFYDYGKGEARLFVWISTGATFKLIWNFWYMSSGFYSSRITNRVVAGDYNGDGKDDICAFYDYGKGESRAFIWKSNGNLFSMDWNYWYMNKGFYSDKITDQIASADFNGDGIDDIVAFYDYGKGEARAFVWQSQGKNFKLNWNYWYMSSGFYVSRITGRITAGDYNGDGKADVFALYDYGKGEARAFVWLARSASLSLNWNYWYMKSGFYCSNYGKRVVTGDFNGDGIDDVCAYYVYSDGTEGKLFMYKSNKTWFKLSWDW